MPRTSANGTNGAKGEEMAASGAATTKLRSPVSSTGAADNSGAARGETIPFIDRERGDEAEMLPPPVDRYNVFYMIVMLHGVGVLLPWNTFLTIGKEYFIDYKLAEANGTEYQLNFFSYLGACSQIPNLLLNLLNLFVVVRSAGLSLRIISSLYVIVAICVLTIILIFVPSTSWPFGFFLLTMLSVVVLNSANGIYQNSLYGMIADFPARFTNAVIVGNNLCGIFISLLAIITLLFSSNIRLATFVYFAIALLTVLAALFSFNTLSRLPFYQHYTMKARIARDKRVHTLSTGTPNGVTYTSGGSTTGSPQPANAASGESGGEADGLVVDEHGRLSLDTYLGLFKEVWRQMFDVFLVFFVTLAIFPAVLVKVQLYPAGRNYDFFYSEAFFRQLTIFLNFNLFATVGNVIANYVQWPSPKYLSLAVLPRLLFIPLFLFTNYIPAMHRGPYPVLITSEWAFLVLVTLLSITHGYLSSLSMMYAPRAVDEAKARVVGMMSGFFLVLGITMGILFTFLEASIFSF